MIQLTPHMRIKVAVEPVDFRKGIDGLAAVCRQVLTSVLSANYVELTIARALRGKSLPRPLNLPEDGLTVGLPPIRLGLKITLSQVFFDISNQLANTGEASLPDNILRYLAKESFHQVHPRRTGRSEMQVETRTSTQPSLHLLMFVCAVVVQDQVDIEFLFGVSRSICLRKRSHSTCV